ncbi:MAG: cysteine-rich CWC family protein [Candidatus Aenigmatarchaeota archaeon]
MARKTCPRCGAEFECAESADCWCRMLKLERAQLEAVACMYVSCMCPDCLSALAAG